MKKFTILSALLVSACGHHSMYVLNDDVKSGEQKTFSGTIISVEKDRDFILEVNNKLLFVDMDKIKKTYELGDRVTVTGITDNDSKEGEATEIDATEIKKGNISGNK